MILERGRLKSSNQTTLSVYQELASLALSPHSISPLSHFQQRRGFSPHRTSWKQHLREHYNGGGIIFETYKLLQVMHHQFIFVMKGLYGDILHSSKVCVSL